MASGCSGGRHDRALELIDRGVSGGGGKPRRDCPPATSGGAGGGGSRASDHDTERQNLRPPAGAGPSSGVAMDRPRIGASPGGDGR
uniref:Uncharacterized protein n=1 Tax=Zea mays TaxID=4577 RepID=C4J4Z9_MAIZE|nr:unknown [Zea mays]